ncbi:uncharacterized protein LOC126969409 isoform X2 [Leptidea sinapis]|nr:uncharacterized protein LOC126969409 isoform X2 [Leptidea sinapis]
MQWTPHTAFANSVYKLYKAYTQLLDNSKASPKAGKKVNKSLNETRETVKSQRSQKSQKEKGKPNKLSNLLKDRAAPFKPLPCLWDMRFCLRLMELLYSEEVTWSSLEQRNQIRGRRDFHTFALRCVQAGLTDKLDKEVVSTTVYRMAALLYTRCVCRFREMCEFDDATALACVEVFKACVTLLLCDQYALKVDSVLAGITGNTDASPSANMSQILSHVSTALAVVDTECDAERDVTARKHAAALAQTAAILLETPVDACAVYNNTVVKLEDYIRSNKQDCLLLLQPLFTAYHREQREAATLDAVLDKLTTALGRIDEEESSSREDSTDYPWIDCRTGHAVLNAVCLHLNVRFKCTEHLLNRAKDLGVAMAFATHIHRQRIDKELKELYKSLIIQLCQLTSWTSCVAKLRCSVGAGSERVVLACVRLYTLLSTLLKLLLNEPDLNTLRLERLLKLCGKKLSAVTDSLITYLEASQENQKASRVLRDTKLIPRLVLEAEQFSKNAIILGNKAKINFQQYLSLGTARDFRIKAPVIHEVLNAQEQARNDVEIEDSITEVHSQVSDNEEQENSQRKRRRIS